MYMANQGHVDILRQGVEVWNKWIKNHFGVLPDFSTPYMVSPGIGKVSEPDTETARAGLSGMDLSGANFGGANLSGTNLSRVNLSRANLTGARLSYTDLQGADLMKSELTGVDFTGSDLRGVNLTEALIGGTIFANVDLSTVKGLDTLIHWGPSTIGIDTIYRSNANISEVFLRGAGTPDTFITYMRSLVDKLIEYNSCFISHSSEDEDFAQRLYNDLQGNGVRCWYAPHDMKTGDRIRSRIYEQIWFNDKLLLILSESSVTSEWVDYEVETALARERKENRDILFPIQLDDAVTKSTTAWAAHIQDARQITNFTRWKEHDEYQKGLTRLLRDLKQEARHDTIASDVHKD
jgi:hypothetical protein